MQQKEPASSWILPLLFLFFLMFTPLPLLFLLLPIILVIGVPVMLWHHTAKADYDDFQKCDLSWPEGMWDAPKTKPAPVGRGVYAKGLLSGEQKSRVSSYISTNDFYSSPVNLGHHTSHHMANSGQPVVINDYAAMDSELNLRRIIGGQLKKFDALDELLQTTNVEDVLHPLIPVISNSFSALLDNFDALCDFESPADFWQYAKNDLVTCSQLLKDNEDILGYLKSLIECEFVKKPVGRNNADVIDELRVYSEVFAK